MVVKPWLRRVLPVVLTVSLVAIGLGWLLVLACRHLAERAEIARLEHENYLGEFRVATRIQELGGSVYRQSGCVTYAVLEGPELSAEMGDLLASLPKLEAISLYQPRDEYLVHLADVQQLKTLHVCDQGLTDNAVAHLVALRGLESVSLEHASLTDSGLQRLALLPNLRVLRVYMTQVTAAGVAEFQRKRPDVTVGWDGSIIRGDFEERRGEEPGQRVKGPTRKRPEVVFRATACPLEILARCGYTGLRKTDGSARRASGGF